MIFGAVCSPFIAQFVKNHNGREFEDEFPGILRKMTHQHYFDDFLDSADTVEEAIKTIHSIIEVHRRGGFPMVNWFSNSPEILQVLPQNYLTESMTLNLGSWNVERVLGLRWNTNEDTLIFTIRLNNIPEELSRGKKPPTKREILRIVLSIFDPIGFLAPLVVQGKLIMQECWSKKMDF